MRTLILPFLLVACAPSTPSVDPGAGSSFTLEQVEERGSGPAWVDAPPVAPPEAPPAATTCTNDQHPERVNQHHANARPDDALRLDNPGTELMAPTDPQPQVMPRETSPHQLAWLQTLRELEEQLDGEPLTNAVAEAKARHFEDER